MPVTADDKHRMRADIYFELTRDMPIPGVAFDFNAVGVENGDYETAYTLWMPLAESGDADAQNYMGILYYLGFGVQNR